MFSFSRLICLIVCVFQLVDDFNENSCSPFLFVSLRYSASWTGGEVEVATHCGLVPSKGALIHIGRRSLVKGAYSEMPCSYWDPELCHTCLFLFTYRHLQRSCRIRVKPYEATWEQTVGEMSGWGLDSFSCFFSNLFFCFGHFPRTFVFSTCSFVSDPACHGWNLRTIVGISDTIPASSPLLKLPDPSQFTVKATTTLQHSSFICAFTFSLHHAPPCFLISSYWRLNRMEQRQVEAIIKFYGMVFGSCTSLVSVSSVSCVCSPLCYHYCVSSCMMLLCFEDSILLCLILPYTPPNPPVIVWPALISLHLVNLHFPEYTV